MITRLSIIGRLARSRFLASRNFRAYFLGGCAIISAVLAVFPERYLATSSFTPSDRDSLGLGGTLGQLGAVSSVFGNQAAVEVALRVGNSDAVRDAVIEKASLKMVLEEENRTILQRYLREKVEIRSLRGGIILLEMLDTDSGLARDIITAYQAAIQEELGRVARRQTEYKREVLNNLVAQAAEDLAVAQTAFNDYRIQNRYTDPRSRIGSMAERVNSLETLIRAKQIDLARARQVFTDGNLTIRQMEAELAALSYQLSQAKSISPDQLQGVGELVQNESMLYALERDLEVAKSLYSGYLRFLRGTSVEDLTADANLRILEPAHVVTKRQYWLPAVAASILILLFWFALEAYVLRPALGDGSNGGSNAGR